MEDLVINVENMQVYHRQREYPHLYASAKVGDESPKRLKNWSFFVMKVLRSEQVR